MERLSLSDVVMDPLQPIGSPRMDIEAEQRPDTVTLKERHAIYQPYRCRFAQLRLFLILEAR
jgi:hypothetical protein